MDIHETEEQQVEALKKWWKENGSSIITGVLLGLAVLFGTKTWFSYQETQAGIASNIYTGMMASLGNGEEAVVTERAGILIADYPGTPYATLAALALAKVKLEQGELTAAHAQLQWALDNAGSDVVRQTVRLRLTRVMIDEENLDGAEALLGEIAPDAAFEPLYAELRGDIQLARGNAGNARAQYEQALTGLRPAAPGYQFVKLKVDNIQPAEDSETPQ
jgi:predicted negative regulator of RcsB-dependent stress response